MSKCGIIFDGVDLGDISPYFRLVDVRYNSPAITARHHDIAGASGQIYGGRKYGARVIDVVFEVADVSIKHRQATLERLRALLNTEDPRKFYDTEKGLDRHLLTVCTAFPDESELTWAEDLQLTLTAFDPLWYSDGYGLDLEMTAGSPAKFHVGCTETIYPIIDQWVGAQSDLTWTSGNGQYIMLQGVVGPGALVIDCTRHNESITLNGVDIMNQMALDSTFFSFAPRRKLTDPPHTITTTNNTGAWWVRAKYRWL